MADEKENKRYLTEIKELPQEEKKEDLAIPKPEPIIPASEKKPETKEAKPAPEPVETQPVQEKTSQVSEPTQEKTSNEAPMAMPEPIIQKKKLPISTKDIVLGIVNLIALGGLIFLLTKLPARAQEVSTARNKELKASQKVSVKLAEIEDSKKLAEEIKAIFPDESGLVDFVKGIEDIRADGTVENITFKNQKTIRDKTGNFGLPVLIIMRGSWQDIKRDMVRVQELPFIFRAVSIETRIDEEGLVVVEYGGILYTNEKIG